MLAYKGFGTGLVCRGYKFREGKQHEEKEANCARNGFHCASNPMDCLYYYPNFKESVYCIVNAGGDIDEDGNDSKIACTELTIVRVLTPEEYLLQIVKYIAKNKEGSIKFFTSSEKWFGMTYPEDREIVKQEIAAKISSGYYPAKLWEK